MSDKPTPDILAIIAAGRQERIQNLHYDYPIPTWEGEVVARFRVAEREDVVNFSEAKRSAEADMDFVIKALESIQVKNPDTGKLEPLLTEAGTFVGFDESLAEKLGVAEQILGMTTPETGPGRVMVAFMFNGNEVAIGACVAQLIMWMQNTDRKIAEDLLGN